MNIADIFVYLFFALPWVVVFLVGWQEIWLSKIPIAYSCAIIMIAFLLNGIKGD